MIERLEAEGFQNSKYKWDDGFDHDDITKVYVRGNSKGIYLIRFDYVKNGQPNNGPFHGLESLGGSGFTQMFEINSIKNEHLESVEGYYDADYGTIKALRFKTNLRISQMIGVEYECRKFKLAVEGKKIIGFHGATALSLNSLGAYFTWVTPTKMEAKGAKGGKEWDDGDHDGVTKINVGGGRDGIQFIKIEYVKAGQPKDGLVHGTMSVGGFIPGVFEIRHGDQECLISVKGYYDESSGVIQGIQFKINTNTSQLMGYPTGKKFRIASNGMKIIGFHGYAEKNLKSLGAYFTTLTPMKLECQGAADGVILLDGGATSGAILWDDGAFEGVRKVYVYYKQSYINLLSFDYENDGKAENRGHGAMGRPTGQEGEFVVDYPDEYITSVEGTRSSESNTWITSLTFKTSQGRTSMRFGNERFGDVGFVFERNGCAFVGFHGRSYYSPLDNNCYLTAFGAYFYRMPPPPPDAKRLEAKGGNGGASWDDGDFEGVKKIYIGRNAKAIVFIKFLYYKDDRMELGDDHGSKTQLYGVQEFELNYPAEYLTSVEGCYDSNSGAITMLRFTTNTQTSPDFGLRTTSTFVHHRDYHKIVGFHGKSSNLFLHKIGVHVIPI